MMKSVNLQTSDAGPKAVRKALFQGEARQAFDKPIQAQMMDWINNGPNWNIAITLHTPMRLRCLQNGHDELWLERQVSVLFHLLSKAAFADTCKKQRPMLRRLITLEKDIYVGWHVHGVVSTPSGLEDEDLVKMISGIWNARMNPYAKNEFKDRLAWCEPITGNFSQYAVKKALSKQSHGQTGQFGLISLKNTVL